MILALVFLSIALGGVVHILRERSRGARRLRQVELALVWLLVGEWGFAGLFFALPHVFAPEWVANYVGWPSGGNFQIELGLAQVGMGVAAILCLWLRGCYLLAPALSKGLFLWGAAVLHVRDWLASGNAAEGNVGPVLFLDIFVPLAVFALLVAYHRLGGTRGDPREIRR